MPILPEFHVGASDRVFRIGDEPEWLADRGLRAVIVTPNDLDQLDDGAWDVAIVARTLEFEEWDRWLLQRVHARLREGGRLLLVVPNLLSFSGPREIAALSFRAGREAARVLTRRLGLPARPPAAFRSRPYVRARLRRMLEGLDFRVLTWTGRDAGMLAPLAAVAPAWVQDHARTHVIVCEKRSPAPPPDPAIRKKRFEAGQAAYVAIRDAWAAANPSFLAPARSLVPAESAGRNVLVLSPHPDDEVIGCGGTLIQLVQAGARVTILQATDGSAAFALRSADEATRRGVRLREAEAVASALGAQELVCWREDNHRFRFDDRRAAELRAWLDSHRPALVFTPFVTDAHEDHLTLNRMLGRALAGLPAAGDTRVVGYEVWSLVPATHYVDVTEVVPARDRLLTMYDTAMKVDDFIHMCAERQAYNGDRLGFAGRMLEVFQTVGADRFPALLETVRRD